MSYATRKERKIDRTILAQQEAREAEEWGKGPAVIPEELFYEEPTYRTYDESGVILRMTCKGINAERIHNTLNKLVPNDLGRKIEPVEDYRFVTQTTMGTRKDGVEMCEQITKEMPQCTCKVRGITVKTS